jgi:type I restriction enzyme M protein
VVKQLSERPDVNPSNDLVNKLWRLCALLRKDGVTYQQYVTELTYLLFLKMASEQKDESRIPEQYRWKALKSANEAEVLSIYKRLLIDLGDAAKVSDRSVVAIFQNAATVIRTPANLRQLIDAIDALHWFSEERDAFGDAYEGLLQRMAEETKRGAGQYFTPRVLIEVLVELMQPAPGEVIQDPAAGTGGFLIAANLYMKARTDDYFNLSPRQQSFQLREALRGLENVPDTYRLLQMNLHLHGVDPNNLDLADTLSPAGQSAKFKNADLILTNPPFGPAGGPPTRDDLTITDRVSSYQLPFVEHCLRALNHGGRAAVVVPDNVLFDDGRGKALRQMLMNRCNLHTILRLPIGLFYAQGVKTNVIFFTRSTDEAPREDATKAVWIYDLRSQAPSYGKTSPFRRADLDDFAAAFGDDPLGEAPRQDQGEEGRFRCFTRKQIEDRGDNLDITWLKDTSADAEDGLDTPEDIAGAIEGHLAAALEEVRALLEELGDAPAYAEADALEVAE